MLEAIASATREVLLEMYWIGPDPVGVAFREALAARARAGVDDAAALPRLAGELLVRRSDGSLKTRTPSTPL